MVATRPPWLVPGWLVLILTLDLVSLPALGAPAKSHAVRRQSARRPVAKRAARPAAPRGPRKKPAPKKLRVAPQVTKLQLQARRARHQAGQLLKRVRLLQGKLARTPLAKAKPLEAKLAKVRKRLVKARRQARQLQRRARALARRLAREAHRRRVRDHRLGQIVRTFRARGFTGVRFEAVQKLARGIPDLGKLVPMSTVVGRLAKLEKEGKVLPGEPLILEMKRWREAKKRGGIAKDSLPPGALTRQERKLYQRQYVAKLLPDLVRYVAFVFEEVFGRYSKQSAAEAVDLLYFYGCKRISRMLPGFARVVKKRVSREVDLMGDWDGEVSPEAFAKKPRGKGGKAPPLQKRPRVEVVEVCTVTHRQLDATLRADLKRIVTPMMPKRAHPGAPERSLHAISEGPCAFDGQRIQAPGGKTIYVMMDGQKRGIPGPGVYDALFRNWDGIRRPTCIDSIPTGPSLGSRARLCTVGTGVFFDDGRVRRHVSSPTAMDRYHFAWNKVKRPCVSRKTGRPIRVPCAGDGRRVVAPKSSSVYLVMDGRKRHIPSSQVYDNLFRSWDGMYRADCVKKMPAGPPLGRKANLCRVGTAVFFDDGQVRRHVASPAVMDRYHFEWSRVRSGCAARRTGRPLGRDPGLDHLDDLVRRVEASLRVDPAAVCRRFGARPAVCRAGHKGAMVCSQGKLPGKLLGLFCKTTTALKQPRGFLPACRPLARLQSRAARACTLRDRRGRTRKNPMCSNLRRPILCRVGWRRVCNQKYRRKLGGRLVARIGEKGDVRCQLRPEDRQRMVATFLTRKSLKKFGLEDETFSSISRHLVGFYRRRGELRNFRAAMKQSGMKIADLGDDAHNDVPAAAKAEMKHQAHKKTVAARNRREILRRAVAQWTEGYEYEQLGSYVRRKPKLMAAYRYIEGEELKSFWRDCRELYAICQEPRAGAEKRACYECARTTLRNHCVEGGDGDSCKGTSKVTYIHVPSGKEETRATGDFPTTKHRLGGNTFLNWLTLQARWEPYQMDFHAGTAVFNLDAFRTAVVRNLVARKFLPRQIDDDKGLTNLGKRYLDSMPISAWQQCVLWNPLFDPKALDGSAADACAEPNVGMKEFAKTKAAEGIPWEKALLFRTVLSEPLVSHAITEMSDWWQKACKETKIIAEATRIWGIFRGKTRYREVNVRDCEKDAADARARTAELFKDQEQLGIDRNKTLKDSGSAISGVLGPVVGKLLGMLLKASGMSQMMKTLAQAAGLNPEQSADCEDPEYRREQMKLPPKQDNKRGCLLKVFAKNFGSVLESVIVMLGNKLVDWGVDLLRALLQAVKSALIAAAGSVPFVGGVLATVVDIAWELLMNFGAKGLLKHFVVAKLPEWLKVRELATQAWETILRNPIVQVVAGVILQLIDAAVTYGGKGWMAVGVDTVLNVIQVYLQNKREYFWLRALVYAKKEMAKTASATGGITEQLLGVAKGMVRGFAAAVARRLDPDTRVAFDEAMTAVEELVSGAGLAKLQADPIGTLMGLLRQKLGPLVLPLIASLANLPSWARSMLEPVSAGIADLLGGKRPTLKTYLARIGDVVKPLAQELLGRIPFGDESVRDLVLEVAGAAEWSLSNLDQLKQKYLDQPTRILQVFVDLAGGFLRKKAGDLAARAGTPAKELQSLLARGLNAAARVLAKSAQQWFGTGALPSFEGLLAKVAPALGAASAGPLSLAEWRALAQGAGRRLFTFLVQALLERALGYAPVRRLLAGLTTAMDVLLSGLPTLSARALMSRFLPQVAASLESFGETVLLAPLRQQRAAYFLVQQVFGAGVALLKHPEKPQGLMRLIDDLGGGVQRLGARVKSMVGGLVGKLVGFVGSPALGKVLQSALGFALQRL